MTCNEQKDNFNSLDLPKTIDIGQISHDKLSKSYSVSISSEKVCNEAMARLKTKRQ